MSLLEEIQETIDNAEGQESIELNFSEIQIGKLTP